MLKFSECCEPYHLNFLTWSLVFQRHTQVKSFNFNNCGKVSERERVYISSLMMKSEQLPSVVYSHTNVLRSNFRLIYVLLIIHSNNFNYL